MGRPSADALVGFPRQSRKETLSALFKGKNACTTQRLKVLFGRNACVAIPDFAREPSSDNDASDGRVALPHLSCGRSHAPKKRILTPKLHAPSVLAPPASHSRHRHATRRRDSPDTARWIRVSGEKAQQFNPGPPITVSIWALGHSYPIRSYETMIAKGDTSWTLQRVQYSTGQGYQCCVRTPRYHLCAYNFAGQGLVTNEWLHFMVVLEEPSMKLYINGQLNTSQSDGPWNKGNHDLGIGNQTQNLGGRRQWDGILDEARVMQAARSPAWAKLDYESQRENPTLLKFGETRTQR